MALSATDLMEPSGGWHRGSGTITYSFIGKTLPPYYDKIDTDGDGTDDAYEIDEFDIPFTEDGSMSLSQRGMIELAVKAWNEVANVNLVQGNADDGSGGTHGTPVTGGGSLAGGLGGESGYGEILVPRNDDGYMNVDISAVFEGGLDFFGTESDGTDVFVNTNGNITFGSGLSTFTPSSISNQLTPLIAAFWGDVDTRIDDDEDTPDSGPIYVDIDADRDIVTFTWASVGYFSVHADSTNSFQIQLYDRGSGDFDIVFRYGSIGWTTGDASGGEGGLGGTPAYAGYTAGDSASFYELPQSANEGAMLGLPGAVGNTGTAGMWVFEVRGGDILGDIAIGTLDMTTTTAGTPSDTAGFSWLPDSASLGTPDHKGDVWINSTETVHELGHSDWYTFLHEMGHALGLQHPGGGDGYGLDASQTVMSYYAHPSVSGLAEADQPWPITPMVLDIAELQAAYGANTSTRHSNTVYFGDATEDVTGERAYQYGAADMKLHGRTVIMTIWDGGGIDLIDASDITKAAVIDLRPGEYSTIGDTPRNVAMAKAVTVDGEVVNLIENVYGTALDDIVFGNQAGNDLRPGLGSDWVEAGDGDDTVMGGAGNDSLKGDGDKDSLIGEAGNDTLKGGTGNDTISGGEGNDKIAGNGQDDSLLGDAGHDKILGGSGADTIDGGEGNDKIRGDGGKDSLLGSAGNDTLLGDDGADELNGGEGNDKLLGGAKNDLLQGGDGVDTIAGNKGNDTLWGNDGDDLMRGDDGKDSLGGGAGNDTVLGAAGADTVYGGEGRDELSGGGRKDVLYGGSGRDKISGNKGDDILDGGTGNDKLRGDSGSDRFVFEGSFGKDRVYGFEVGRAGEAIDLSAVASITDFTDLRTHHMSVFRDAHVLIDAGGDNKVLLIGIDIDALSASDFVF